MKDRSASPHPTKKSLNQARYENRPKHSGEFFVAIDLGRPGKKVGKSLWRPIEYANLGSWAIMWTRPKEAD
jgi:hypothetical protein